MLGKKLTAALVRQFTVRGAAMAELFDGEYDDLARELRDIRAGLPRGDIRARLIDVSLEMDALPAMRGAMRVCEAARMA